MPERSFTLDIVTPEQLVLSEDVVSLTVPGVEGYLGILAGHAPLMAELRSGVIEARRSDRTRVAMQIGGGFMEVSHNRAIVLADSAEPIA
ncbi:MAG TPA: ATP synthase F1 subunit epsilon [Armatimonadota bacterium]|jgi:F-type H+-transporting ATPase subunit epsilon|nr:ATP synthase F1 subunit epsilon [Armatimonadota bacterium]HOJ22450.1 ATP synthase F1 subunit epsilon [Armatimonadota bacterium]HOM83793.1 ATP synthase F1 subunit epsilon [Armatimonadota bacterium]HOQ27514.1 ATP synthase F1 subunit epsilon [Armatimonadota bacterium]HPO74149.1 ATP synthase F1 subunit epsilon [Armatimonadota bacterium]